MLKRGPETKVIFLLPALIVMAACSASDSYDESMPTASPEAAEEACSLTYQYAIRGLPATYTADAVDLVLSVADRFYDGGLTDAGTAMTDEVVPALQGGILTQIQVRPLLNRIYNDWCS
jgi:hypothetical protein